MKRKRSLLAVSLAATLFLWGMAVSCASAPAVQSVAAAPLNLPIWPDAAAAGADSTAPKEQESVASWHERFIRNVTQASVDVYLPESSRANGGAMIVCPGGGFRFLTMEGEGEQVEHWLNQRGIAAFILHYRLKPTPRSDLLFYLRMLIELPPLLSGKAINDPKAFAMFAPPAIADGTQAVRFVRSRAEQWHLAPDRIGMLGFSAGGVVAVGASLATDARDRPDFTAALYSGPLDTGPVPADAPPLFAAAAADDPLTALGTQPFAAAWKAGGAPVELHIYQKGGHGFGMQKKGTDSDRWVDDFSAWLEARHL